MPTLRSQGEEERGKVGTKEEKGLSNALKLETGNAEKKRRE